MDLQPSRYDTAAPASSSSPFYPCIGLRLPLAASHLPTTVATSGSDHSSPIRHRRTPHGWREGCRDPSWQPVATTADPAVSLHNHLLAAAAESTTTADADVLQRPLLQASTLVNPSPLPAAATDPIT